MPPRIWTRPPCSGLWRSATCQVRRCPACKTLFACARETIETVLMRYGRTSDCVPSTQVAARLVVFLRHRQSRFNAEHQQWRESWTRSSIRPPSRVQKQAITNLVFMGRATLANYDAPGAQSVLDDTRGFWLGARRFNISTAAGAWHPAQG